MSSKLMMKTRSIILVILLALFVINSCKKDGGGQNQSNNNNNNKDTTKNTPPPAPTVSITQTPLTILLPNNCQQSFTITNTGPQGSTLNYSIADDGALGGFLSFTNGTGALGPGASATIGVTVKAGSVNSNPSLVGASLVLNVYTPKASNFVKVAVPVNIKSIAGIASSLIGTWSGTWTGNSYGANNPTQAQPSAPISGTWTINLKTVDTATMTATGSLTWNGADAYWTYTFDKNGLITSATPNLFKPDRTIQFDATNTTFIYNSSQGGCSQSDILLTISGFKNQPNPSDAFYGPQFTGDFNVITNTVISIGNGFSAHPYAPVTFATNVSNGTITGKKQ
jgi:hypothetical protein